MHKPMISLILSCLFVLFCSSLQAQTEFLDPSFGNNGITITDGRVPFSIPQTILVQPDGKVVVVGGVSGQAPEWDDFGLNRYLPDGRPDSSFGGDGKIHIHFLGSDRATSAVIQPDGKLVVAGMSRIPYTPGGYYWSVLRIHPDGNLDTDFGDGGKVSIDGWQSGTVKIMLQADGKIILGGNVSSNMYLGFSLMRLLPNGDPDMTFGTNGQVVQNNIFFSDFALQQNQQILVLGEDASNICLQRFDTHGVLDQDFGIDGLLTFFMGIGTYPYGLNIKIQPDGYALMTAARLAPAEDSYQFFLVRLDPSGSGDPSFGLNGFLYTSINYEANIDSKDVTILLDDGRIVLLGSKGDNYPRPVTAYGLLPAGSPDFDFGVGGKTELGIRKSRYSIQSVSSAPNGALWVLGDDANSIMLTKLHSDGMLDVQFGIDGTLRSNFQERSSYDFIEECAILPNGKIVAAGYAIRYIYNTTEKALLFRFLGDGTPDNSFGNQGRVFIDDMYYINAIVPLSNDKMLVAGHRTPEGASILSFQADGTLDTSFGAAGIVSLPLYFPNIGLRNLALQPDGKILIAGATMDVDLERIVLTVVRLHPDGSLDTTFGNQGIAKGDIEENAWFEDVSLMLMPAGEMVVLASSYFLASEKGVILRLLANGLPDTGFGSNGFVSSYYLQNPRAAYVQSDGKLVVGGGDSEQFSNQAELIRLNADGSEDLSFGVNGRTFLNDVSYFAMLRQSSGDHFWASGPSSFVNGGFTLCRFLADGQPDSTFGDNGRVVGDTEGFYSTMGSMIVQSDGKVVLAGSNDMDAVLMRFTPSPVSSVPFRADPYFNAAVSPNPASDRAELSLEIFKPIRNISVILMNTESKVVETLVHSGSLPEGTHRIPLHLEALDSGVYFVKIISDSGEQTLRLVHH